MHPLRKYYQGSSHAHLNKGQRQCTIMPREKPFGNFISALSVWGIQSKWLSGNFRKVPFEGSNFQEEAAKFKLIIFLYFSTLLSFAPFSLFFFFFCGDVKVFLCQTTEWHTVSDCFLGSKAEKNGENGIFMKG